MSSTYMFLSYFNSSIYYISLVYVSNVFIMFYLFIPSCTCFYSTFYFSLFYRTLSALACQFVQSSIFINGSYSNFQSSKLFLASIFLSSQLVNL